jgi:hypothetical protein
MQLYAQCLIGLIACFLYRYQRLSDPPQPSFLTPKIAMAAIICKRSNLSIQKIFQFMLVMHFFYSPKFGLIPANKAITLHSS